MVALLLHAFYRGAVVSVLLGALFAIITLINPEFWLPDDPPDIRARHGPIGNTALKQRKPRWSAALWLR